MLISSHPEAIGQSVIVQLHTPGDGGQFLRSCFEEVMGNSRCLYGTVDKVGELAQHVSGDIRFVFVEGDIEPVREAFKTICCIAVVRDPIDRYLALYANFRDDTSSKYHDLSHRYDVNEFIKFAFDSGDSGLLQYFGNPQCRTVCGSPDFQIAKECIQEKFYLACPYPESGEMARILGLHLDKKEWMMSALSTAIKSSGISKHEFSLSQASVKLLNESENQDALLYSYIQKVFFHLNEIVLKKGAKPAKPKYSDQIGIIPPKELRFMAETDEGFIHGGDYLANSILHRFNLNQEFSNLLDIGCGYGRLAYGLRRAGFNGQYRGFDILSRHIAWLDQNFHLEENDRRYQFLHSDSYNERYNPKGKPLDHLELPYPAASFDCMVSLSVFTHLYENEVVQYIRYLKNFLSDDGVWTTTFFVVPPDFDLEKQEEGARFPLVEKISDNAYIHSKEEPLLAIAYREQFLLDLFAQEGLEVVKQCKGRWLTGENASELQDWFVLRKRSNGVRQLQINHQPPTGGGESSSTSAVSAGPVCNVCGCKDFFPGPYGRMASSGLPPRCGKCGSLERHRILRQVFHAFPTGFLDWRRGLQFSLDQGVETHWFRSYEISIYGGNNSLDAQAIAREDGSYDFLSLNHVLECVPDDVVAFGELCRVLSPSGIMQICFGLSNSRKTTVDLDEPIYVWKTLHQYGRDLPERFKFAEKGLAVLMIEESDPCTGVRDVVHFFAKRQEDVERMKNWLSIWSKTVKFL